MNGYVARNGTNVDDVMLPDSSPAARQRRIQRSQATLPLSFLGIYTVVL